MALFKCLVVSVCAWVVSIYSLFNIAKKQNILSLSCFIKQEHILFGNFCNQTENRNVSVCGMMALNAWAHCKCELFLDMCPLVLWQLLLNMILYMFQKSIKTQCTTSVCYPKYKIGLTEGLTSLALLLHEVYHNKNLRKRSFRICCNNNALNVCLLDWIVTKGLLIKWFWFWFIINYHPR